MIRDPQTLGLYHVEEMLGRGGMGAVYRCRHEHLGVIRAVKLLTGRMTPQRVERFSREAQALARLNHPSVVAIHDVGQTPTGELYYAMDLIEGKPLDEALDGPGTVDAEDAAREGEALPRDGGVPADRCVAAALHRAQERALRQGCGPGVGIPRLPLEVVSHMVDFAFHVGFY